MKKDILTFNDETTVEIESGSSLTAITVVSESKENFISLWDRFTRENLSTVKISNSSDVGIAEYSNLILVSETSEILSDGKVKTLFNLREMTESEITIAALQTKVNEQADALDELAMVVAEREG